MAVVSSTGQWQRGADGHQQHYQRQLGGLGGGICNLTGGSQGGSVTLTLSNSTLSDNSAGADGRRYL